MKRVGFRLALAIIICTATLAWVNQPGKADVAPQPPPKGVSIEPGAETTNVRMMSEIVTMKVASYSLSSTGVANVTASFQMLNLTADPSALSVSHERSNQLERGFAGRLRRFRDYQCRVGPDILAAK